MIKYTIEKSRYDDDYILWKTMSTDKGICSKNKFKGSYKKCVEHKKTLEEEEKKNNGRSKNSRRKGIN